MERLWLRRLRDHLSHICTAATAALVCAMVLVPALLAGLFGRPDIAGTPPLLAAVLLALSLMDRFRPSRWFLLTLLPLVWLRAVLVAQSSEYEALAFFEAACATGAWVLLHSHVVREHFASSSGRIERFLHRTGLGPPPEEESAPDAALLPPETVESVLSGARAVARTAD